VNCHCEVQNSSKIVGVDRKRIIFSFGVHKCRLIYAVRREDEFSGNDDDEDNDDGDDDDGEDDEGDDDDDEEEEEIEEDLVV
jgi:hypothetical protein